jgi:hypothetical protein
MFPVFLLATQFAQLGDAVSVTLDSSVTYASTTNVYKTSARTSANYFVWSPGVKLDFSQGESNFDLSLMLAYDLNRYQSLSNLDSDLLKASLFGSYRGAFTQVLLNYGRTEGQSAQADLTGSTSANFEDLIETNSDNLSLIAKYKYSPKLSISSGVEANNLSYSTYASQFSSKESFTIPLDIIYHFSEKLDVIYGIEYTNREIGFTSSGKGGYSTDSMYYKVGLSGEIRPKLDGNISVGLRHIDFSNEDVVNYSRTYKETFGLQSNLSWRLTPKFSSILFLTRNYDTAGSGDSYNQTKVSLINRYLINSEFSINTLASLSSKKFLSGSRRTDELDRYEVNLDYFPHQNVIISMGYAYTDSRAASKYAGEDFSLRASILY